MQYANILATKLYTPSLPEDWIARPEVNRRLDQGLSRGHALSLVSAPAGFGKTTCVSAWAQTVTERAVVWLTLDALDDDAARFFSYFIAALQQADPSLGRTLASVLRAGETPPADALAASLLNDLHESARPLVMVLDDFHLILSPTILQVMEQLITYLPEGLQLLLVTREDPPLPLARMRAQGRLTEVRAAHLQFSREETVDFLHKAVGPSLDAADIDALEKRTEGWIAGLQLSALALREGTPTGRSVPGLQGSHHFIYSYLTEQVFDQQPAPIQQFLLKTSILNHLQADLCNAVTGADDCAAILERLRRANLFLNALAEKQEWYCYHSLYRDFLLQQLRIQSPDEQAELHRRACRWYARAGMVEEAMEHALAADDLPLTASLFEEHGMRLLMQGHVETVRRWTARLPVAWESYSPRFSLTLAWIHLMRGESDAAAPYMKQTQATMDQMARLDPVPDDNQAAIQGEWLVLQSLLSYRSAQGRRAKDLASQALALTPNHNSRVLCLVYYALASSCRLLQETRQATEAYQLAVQHARSVDYLFVEMLSTVGLANMAYEQGRLRLTYQIASPVIDRLEASNTMPPIAAVLYGMMVFVHYHWRQLPAAHAYLARTLELSTLGGYASGVITCHAYAARLHQCAGDYAAATAAMQQALDKVRADTPEEFRQEVIAHQVKLHVAMGQLDGAELALQAEGYGFSGPLVFPNLVDDEPLLFARGLCYNAALQLLLAQVRTGRGIADVDELIAVADRVIAMAEQTELRLIALEAYLLRAQLLVLRGRSADLMASRKDYLAALRLGAPEEIVSLFLEQDGPVIAALSELFEDEIGRDGSTGPLARAGVPVEYVGSLLTAHAQRPSTQMQPPYSGVTDAPRTAATGAVQPLVEPLTDREVEVLGLMADGLTYREIAQRLFVSVNTVRYHVKAVYGKMGVHKRTLAIERAKELRLL